MSFALEYRKKLQLKNREAQRIRKAHEGFVSAPAGASHDTPGMRRRVLLALVIAGGVLGVFNSGGLVQYTRQLADTPLGPRLIVMSETWHEAMQEKNVTQVVEQIRETVAMARESNWRDLTFGLRLNPHKLSPGPQKQPTVVPAKGKPAPEPEEEKPRMARPAGPILRAAVDRLP